ncbi:uncharacterized protein DUF3263 [Mumia flava]|uniref:Uncharacterized protein DUF3263 n=1 Tax=Mumia flava TaxID=1348852 RepID=A0A2M9BGE5_9ACTN|nr:DUF3263 domain-containing protein [Mumia flava]PJJ57023.1 uncharacterized protein DUF3263 [Mumia flava]
MQPAPLTETERDILAFERGWWKHAGIKEQAVRERFGLTATRYHQRLNALIDREAALEHDPLLVRRLRRLRDDRRQSRTSRRRRPASPAGTGTGEP